ncbi:MAG: DUF2889 domain-containing protein [Rhodocyclaceae bacterium]|jgi:hypothetical protein|nr:DUF2889 domain-containing protein [Rhodocyclaceae bacterium]
MTIHFTDFEGTYRRLIDLKAWDPRTVVGWLEDDYHHFGITLVHDGARITDLRVAEPRYPWTACPGAAEPLKSLIGKPLFGRCADVGQYIDMRLQCTHLFDLAGLLAAHAYHQRDHHRYHAVVSRVDTVEPAAPKGWVRGSLSRDGATSLAWDVELDSGAILQPAEAAGKSIDRGFREWIEGMDEARAEQAFVLRRAIFVSRGRKITLTEPHVANDMGMPPVCHNHQPGQRMASVRILESIRRFNAGPAGMLALVDTKP